MHGIPRLPLVRPLARLEEVDVAAAGIEGEAAAAQIERSRQPNCEGLQPIQMEVELRNVVAAVRAARAPHIERMGEIIERPVDDVRHARRAQVGGSAGRGAGDRPFEAGQLGVEPVARAAEAAERLDDRPVEIGDVADQRLEHRERALPPAVEQGAGDGRLAARAGSAH